MACHSRKSLKPSPYIVGLTGGIGSGKSTASAFFKEYGAFIIDVDSIARELLKKSSSAYQAVLSHFSRTILDDEDNIHREKLRAIIFNHPAEKAWLEAYLHPQIRREISHQIEKLSTEKKISYIILDIPLLKNRLDFPFLNRILVIDCPEELQMEHALQRSHLSREILHKIMASQITRQERNTLADDLIRNDQDKETLRQEVYRLHCQYLDSAHKMLL